LRTSSGINLAKLAAIRLASSRVSSFAQRNKRPALRQTQLASRRRLDIVQMQRLEATLAKGTVKWFNETKGYGFIQPMGGGKDVFVHISAVERAGLSTLNEGQTVEYEEVASKGKTSAENLKVGR
jgi:CspA family cold shock protein